MIGAQLFNAAVSHYNGIRIVDQRISSRIVFLTPILRAVERRTASSATTPRLKREEIRYIDYDSAFSQWKVRKSSLSLSHKQLATHFP